MPDTHQTAPASLPEAGRSPDEHMGADGLPPLPQELEAELSARDHRLIVALVGGANWQEALDATKVPQRARLRDYEPPERIKRAVDYLVKELALRAAVSRSWIQVELVKLYRRACQAEPVRDRRGEPTGEYRFDGATAKRCLELLGQEIGMFGKRSGAGIAVNGVAQLLKAVAERGKPALAVTPARAISAPAAIDPKQGERLVGS